MQRTVRNVYRHENSGRFQVRRLHSPLCSSSEFPTRTATTARAQSAESNTRLSRKPLVNREVHASQGHASLTAFILIPDATHIITVNRDEHICVSWFSQGYTAYKLKTSVLDKK